MTNFELQLNFDSRCNNMIILLKYLDKKNFIYKCVDILYFKYKVK